MRKSGQKSTRRDFLKAGMLGIAATAFAPAALGAGTPDKPVQAAKRRLVHRTLGRTGIRVPIVSVGGGNITDAAILRIAMDAGLTHIDTARSYGRGANETLIASVIKERPRDSFVIATKSFNPAVDNRTGIYKSTTNAEIFGRDLDESLKTLGLEYVDIFYIHDIVRGESILMESVLRAFEKAKQSGKARAIGVSTHRGEPEVIRAAIETKIWDVVLTAYNFRQPHLAEVTKAIAEAAAAGLGIVAMKTQAGVFWDPERKQPINAKAALKWALQNENMHTAIPGVSTHRGARGGSRRHGGSRSERGGKRGSQARHGAAGARSLLRAVRSVRRAMPLEARYSDAHEKLHVRVRIPEARAGAGDARRRGNPPRAVREVPVLHGRLHARLSRARARRRHRADRVGAGGVTRVARRAS